MSEGPISPIVFHNYKNTANSFWTSLRYVAVLISYLDIKFVYLKNCNKNNNFLLIFYA